MSEVFVKCRVALDERAMMIINIVASVFLLLTLALRFVINDAEAGFNGTR